MAFCYRHDPALQLLTQLVAGLGEGIYDAFQLWAMGGLENVEATAGENPLVSGRGEPRVETDPHMRAAVDVFALKRPQIAEQLQLGEQVAFLIAHCRCLPAFPGLPNQAGGQSRRGTITQPRPPVAADLGAVPPPRYP